MERRLEGEVQEDAVLISPKKPRIGLTEEEIRALGRAMKQEDGAKIEIEEDKYKRVDEENKEKEDETEEEEAEGEREEESAKWKKASEALKAGVEAGARETKIKAQVVEEGKEEQKGELMLIQIEEKPGKDGSTPMPGSSSLADFSSEEESPVTTSATS
ncbi:hypothetical protein P167DRAFT_572731 [Morchella conica CCBAS932]|uniref:Uncharacterized protein n=1 Tax=Morchella conica CCBAS932 TaxID=1392247 RepID=A0A3N4KUK4_9PEZI|nr:hypothetical protein P167DRAFT_572731 [Morchella conica CCBAS932]